MYFSFAHDNAISGAIIKVSAGVIMKHSAWKTVGAMTVSKLPCASTERLVVMPAALVSSSATPIAARR